MSRQFSFQIIHLTCIATLLFRNIPASSQDKAPSSPIPVLKTQVRLVVLDVLVTDNHGKAILNLKPEDFILTESGTPQTVKTLENHTVAIPAPSTAIVSPTATEKPLPAGTYTNQPKFQGNIWNVVVVDMLNTPPQDQAAARDALRTFAGQLPAGAPLALLVMNSDSIKMLVPFTSGGTEISKLLQGNSLFPTRPRMLDTYNADEEFEFEEAANAAGSGGDAMKDAQRETEMGRLQIRAQQTLRSLDLLAVWLSRFPGKKNLFWLSAGFPLSAEPQTARDGLSDAENAKWLRSFADLQHDTDARLETPVSPCFL
jgi:VWFA-related protein